VALVQVVPPQVLLVEQEQLLKLRMTHAVVVVVRLVRMALAYPA
jgi:hypothetical protein